jgi:hypothetical protein
MKLPIGFVSLIGMPLMLYSLFAGIISSSPSEVVGAIIIGILAYSILKASRLAAWIVLIIGVGYFGFALLANYVHRLPVILMAWYVWLFLWSTTCAIWLATEGRAHKSDMKWPSDS